MINNTCLLACVLAAGSTNPIANRDPLASAMFANGRGELAPAKLNQILESLAQLPAPMRDSACEALFAPRNGRSLAQVSPAICFAPGTPDEVVRAWHESMHIVGGGFSPRFQPAIRWESTATQPGDPGIPGTPVVLTYSFVPDGTNVPAAISQPDRPSDLFTFMDTLYGNRQTWQDLFHDSMRRWSEVSGITYVYEPMDDGATLVGSVGIPGSRGDVRIAGAIIDGGGGVLAYNYYPEVGDMVIDTADTYWAANLANNSRSLRNVIAHEAGHGLGMAHVCPVTTSKLMEPFVTNVFDGLRHDDIRHAHYWYGDSAEPNNTIETATELLGLSECNKRVLGPISEPGVQTPFASLYSINSELDFDWFAFTPDVTQLVTITVRPVGFSYDDSPQDCAGNQGSCCSGNIIDSRQLGDLNFEIYNRATNALIATSNQTGAGQAETLTIPLSGQTDYGIRIAGIPPEGSPQSYNLELSGVPATVTWAINPAMPTSVAPATEQAVTVAITSGANNIAPNGVRLIYRVNGGQELTTPMTRLINPVRYVGTLPGSSCGNNITYRVSAQLALPAGELIGLPCGGGEAELFIGEKNTVFADSFEIDRGWTINNIAVTDGGWERAQPAGDALRGDPLTDADGNGWCMLTGNRPGNSDLDGGPTQATSPVFNLSQYTGGFVSMRRWFALNTADQDRMRIEVSGNDGASWTVVDEVANDPQWTNRIADLAAFNVLTSTMRVRVTAIDNPNNSVAEAAFDDVRIVAWRCNAGPTCYADFNNDGGVDGSDVESFYLAWQAGEPGADVNEDGGVDGTDVEAFFVQWAVGGC